MSLFLIRSAYGNRTRVSAVRGPRPRPLDESAIIMFCEPNAGLEPATLSLRMKCSTN